MIVIDASDTMATVSSLSAVRSRDPANVRARSVRPTSCLTLIVLMAVTINLSLSTVDACSMPQGWRAKTPVEKVLDARVVLYATVIRNVPDQRFDYGGTNTSTAYTSEIEVHCILKGRPTSSRVNISQAGHVPGLCHSTNLVVGRQYLLLVRVDEGVYTTTSGELDADTEQQLAQLTVACNLAQTYPTGVDASSASVKCPSLAPPGECKSKQDFPGSNTPSDGPEDGDGEYDYGEPKPIINVGETKTASSSYYARPSLTVILFIAMVSGITAIAQVG